jgi:biopolymer transport protein ExbD
LLRFLTVIFCMVSYVSVYAIDSSPKQFIPVADSLGDEVRVEIASDGALYLNGDLKTLTQLKSFFNELPESPNDSVLVIADEAVKKTLVIRVMDICCNYKYNRVRLIYQPVWINKS